MLTPSRSTLPYADNHGSDHPAVLGTEWIRLRLVPGVKLVMPPGMTHAVVTSEDSLCVGGFVLLKEQIPRSLRTIIFQEDNPATTNDNPPVQVLFAIINFLRDNPERRHEWREPLKEFAEHSVPNSKINIFRWPARKQYCIFWSDLRKFALSLPIR